MHALPLVTVAVVPLLLTAAVALRSTAAAVVCVSVSGTPMMADQELELIRQTQALLGQLIKKPILTEKLLRRPPFKLLHDIIVNVSVSLLQLPLPSLSFCRSSHRLAS